MGFLGFNSINEAEAIGRREDAKRKREDEARRKREADPEFQQRQRAIFATKYAPQIASVLAKQKTRPIMKINRPPDAGRFLRVAPSVAVPVEKMVM